MALVHIPKQDREISKPEEIREFLSDYGIQFEQWDVAGRLTEDATDEQILAEYAPEIQRLKDCLLYTSPSPRDRQKSRMPSSA